MGSMAVRILSPHSFQILRKFSIWAQNRAVCASLFFVVLKSLETRLSSFTAYVTGNYEVMRIIH